MTTDNPFDKKIIKVNEMKGEAEDDLIDKIEDNSNLTPEEIKRLLLVEKLTKKQRKKVQEIVEKLKIGAVLEEKKSIQLTLPDKQITNQSRSR